MLIRCDVQNFLSFDDRISFSMAAAADKMHPENAFETEVRGNSLKGENRKERFLKSAILYGANASGKTNLVRVFSFMRHFVTRSAGGSGLAPEEPTGVEPFRLSSARRSEPSEFETELLLDGVVYVYGFSADERRVREEWLYEYPKGKKRKVFHRLADRTPSVDFGSGSGLSHASRTALTELTPANTLFLPQVAKANDASGACKNVYEWFSKKLRIIFSGSVAERSNGMTPALSRSLSFFADEAFQKDVVGFLRDVDSDICNLKYIKSTKSIPENDKKLMRALMEYAAKTGGHDGADARIPNQIPSELDVDELVTFHSSKDGGDPVPFKISEESLGTRQALGLYGVARDAMQKDALLVIDEVESSLHPLLLQHLFRTYHALHGGACRAQIVCTTHSIEPLREKLFRRDQIWFVEKKRGASELYSLRDFTPTPRENSPWEAWYLDGRFGGVPMIDAPFSCNEAESEA